MGRPADGSQRRVAVLPGDIVEQAAWLLWEQLRARLLTRPDVEYWRQMVADVEDRASQHRAAIGKKLAELRAKLGGLRFEPMDMWQHIDRVADDPHTVVSINPPTYTGGFERFFDTKGRLTWAGPAYEVFDPEPGIPRLVEMMEGRAALLLCQQQREPGQAAHPVPVFGRHLSLGQYVYLCSNRPAEVFQITGGPRVASRKLSEFTPAEAPPLPHDHEVTTASRIVVLPVRPAVTDYYRHLWMHRISTGTHGPGSLLITVDGFAAGVIGYSTDTMSFSYHDKWASFILLRYAIGAPHATLRTARLATMVALEAAAARAAMTGQAGLYVAASTGLVTVEMTRRHEAKGLRGLMKLTERRTDPDVKGQFRLIYTAPWRRSGSFTETLAEFLAKEERWLKTRSQVRG
jgi:hypothetical protein